MRAIGTTDLEKHQAGEELTPKRAMHAKCADCTANYADGKYDCELPGCPLYRWMPYRGVKES